MIKNNKLKTAIVVLLVILILLFLWLLVQQKNKDDAPAVSEPNTSLASGAYSIVSGGLNRTYRLYVPKNLPKDTSVPLVVMMHGGGGSAEQAENAYNWDQEADSNHFVVAYPDGLGKVSAWNVDGGCCGYPERDGVNDIQFILDLVSQIESKINIDNTRVFATGMSNGAILSYSLACETNVFAAIGSVSGTMVNECKNPHPTSVLEIHGLEDTHIRFDGAPGTGFGSTVKGPPVPEVIADWRKIDDCGPVATSSKGVVTTSVSSCQNGRSVELVTIADMGHSWPGGEKQRSDTPGRQTSDAIDGTSYIWQFFEAHPKE